MYNAHNFEEGGTIFAEDFNNMDSAILEHDTRLSALEELINSFLIRCESIIVEPSSISGCVGAKVALTITKNPSNATEPLKLISSDTDVAICVDEEVTLLKEGICNLTISCGSSVVTIPINVTQADYGTLIFNTDPVIGDGRVTENTLNVAKITAENYVVSNSPVVCKVQKGSIVTVISDEGYTGLVKVFDLNGGTVSNTYKDGDNFRIINTSSKTNIEDGKVINSVTFAYNGTFNIYTSEVVTSGNMTTLTVEHDDCYLMVSKRLANQAKITDPDDVLAHVKVYVK